MPAVTLDLWHTLIYLPPEAEEAYMNNQVRMGTEVLRSAPRIPGARDLPEPELRRAFERAYAGAVTASTEGKTVTPTEQLLRAARETGRHADPKQYLAMLKHEIETTQFRRADGALELLADLRDGGYRVAIISNTVGEPGAFLRPVLSSMGFDRFVESYVFSDEHPWTKPSPEIFRYALDSVEETPADAVHVGDGWSDLEGAHRAQYRGAILFTGLHEYGAQYSKLFLPGVPEDPHTSYRTDRLAEVGPMVRRLLPPT